MAKSPHNTERRPLPAPLDVKEAMSSAHSECSILDPRCHSHVRPRPRRFHPHPSCARRRAHPQRGPDREEGELHGQDLASLADHRSSLTTA